MIATSREFYSLLSKHIEGLPKYVTEMTIKLKTDELVEITATFHPVYRGVVGDEPVTKTFTLMENDDETNK